MARAPSDGKPGRIRAPRRAPPAEKTRALPQNWSECVRGERIVWENRRVRSELVCFGDVMYEPGGRSGPRQQRDFQLVFLHSGELTAWVDGKQHRLSAGQVGLFLPGSTEVFEISEELATHHAWCTVALSRVPEALQQQLASMPRSLPCDDLQARLLAAGMALDGADSDVERGIVDQIGVALLGAYVKAAMGQAAAGVVARAVRYMQEHLTEADCLVHAHVAAGVSRNTLLRRFHIELGVTPARHLWRLRAERGIALLAKTEQTVAEIAFACGFSDPFHFSRVVKSLQGVSPKELRQRLPGS